LSSAPSPHDSLPIYADHGMGGDGGSGRGAQQGGQRAILGGDQFRAEFQLAASAGIPLNDLDPLAGLGERPVFLTRLREEVAQGVNSLLVGLEDLAEDRKSTRLNSSHVKISYAVFCL